MNANGAFPTNMSRREALRLLALHLPIALAACGKPEQEIVPYVTMPEGLVPGEPMRFATVLPLSGLGRGVIVTSIDGRPTKVEGNPRHPCSLGSTDVFSEASILSLYDPDRSRTPLIDGKLASWRAIESSLQPVLDDLRDKGGEGLALLTGRIASPTFAAQIGRFFGAYPKARWFAYDPLWNGAAEAGAHMAFGRNVSMLPNLAEADIVVSYNSDFLGPGSDQIRLSRAYGERRVSSDRQPPRLYAFEVTPTQTGGKADHRRAVSISAMLEMLVEIANALGADVRPAQLDEDDKRICDALIQDLRRDGARSLILAGPALPPEGHALAYWINDRLGAPVSLIPPPDEVLDHAPESLGSLAEAIDRRSIKVLAALDVNPLYDAPGGLDLASRLQSNDIALLHAGMYNDETGALARWHLPLSHPLESWSDLRATDGSSAIAQPLIRPLYSTRSLHEVLSTLLGEQSPNGYDIVRANWAGTRTSDFETWWADALTSGVVPDSGLRSLEVPSVKLPESIPESMNDEGLNLVLRPDPCLWDGSCANNAWLQELPKPMTKQVWGHALEIGATDAVEHELATGDRVEVRAGDRVIECPVIVTSGQATGVVSLTLGLGRTRAGMIGTDVGANGYLLRSLDSAWVVRDVKLQKTTRREELLLAQNIVRTPDITRAALEKRFPVVEHLDQGARPSKGKVSLYPERPRQPAEHAWAMVIDTALCTGCNACVIACQAENNIPVVGPQEIDIGRQMHWLRIDVYDTGHGDEPSFGFQPVLCMHCEKAPCEPVCPVEASVHDGEGLNVQVYNRCIGTRFCEANCPYKVRRFNFRAYADGEEFANLGSDSYRAQKNPDVTVRTRGVMEKCTYCIQRISAARRRSERDDRPIGLDEVVTACQAACPTRAIKFGDQNQPEAAVTRLKAAPRHYALLDELGTRPRTTYLAEIRTRNPAVDEAQE